MATNSRNSNQEKAMTIIYQSLIYDKANINYDITEIISDVLETNSFSESDFFVREVVIKALLHKEEIISVIEPNLVRFKFSRLNLVAQAILLLSYAHYYYVKDVAKSIVIDVAIKLAKKYLDDGDYRYINAVLDKVLNEN